MSSVFDPMAAASAASSPKNHHHNNKHHSNNNNNNSNDSGGEEDQKEKKEKPLPTDIASLEKLLESAQLELTTIRNEREKQRQQLTQLNQENELLKNQKELRQKRTTLQQQWQDQSDTIAAKQANYAKAIEDLAKTKTHFRQLKRTYQLLQNGIEDILERSALEHKFKTPEQQQRAQQRQALLKGLLADRELPFLKKTNGTDSENKQSGNGKDKVNTSADSNNISGDAELPPGARRYDSIDSMMSDVVSVTGASLYEDSTTTFTGTHHTHLTMASTASSSWLQQSHSTLGSHSQQQHHHYPRITHASSSSNSNSTSNRIRTKSKAFSALAEETDHTRHSTASGTNTTPSTSTSTSAAAAAAAVAAAASLADGLTNGELELLQALAEGMPDASDGETSPQLRRSKHKVRSASFSDKHQPSKPRRRSRSRSRSRSRHKHDEMDSSNRSTASTDSAGGKKKKKELRRRLKNPPPPPAPISSPDNYSQHSTQPIPPVKKNSSLLVSMLSAPRQGSDEEASADTPKTTNTQDNPK